MPSGNGGNPKHVNFSGWFFLSHENSKTIRKKCLFHKIGTGLYTNQKFRHIVATLNFARLSMNLSVRQCSTGRTLCQFRPNFAEEYFGPYERSLLILSQTHLIKRAGSEANFFLLHVIQHVRYHSEAFIKSKDVVGVHFRRNVVKGQISSFSSRLGVWCIIRQILIWAFYLL